MSDPTSKQKIVAKLIRVYEAIDCVAKSGHNTSQNYNYVRAADVVRAVRVAFIKEKIYAQIDFSFEHPPYTIARARELNAPFTAVNVKCSILLHDLDSGETMPGSGLGTGADSSDKAVYKAQTGALKYALRHVALVPDEAGTDPEADESVDEAPEPRSGRVYPAPAEIPDFHDAAHEAPKPRPAATKPAGVDTATLSGPTAPAPAAAQTSAPAPAAATPQAAPAPAAAPEREPGDEPADSTALPTEAELTVFRAKFAALGDELTANGKLKASKGLPVNRKLVVFLLSITKAESAKILTKSQWEDFFKRAEAAKALENGLVGLAKLVNKANGIEETKK